MYYSFKCTYCRRPFYTYDRNRVNASVTLYRAVKKHLIDYNEDHKEHEMDDGEQEDSNQVYDEMTESEVPPPGGISAIPISADTLERHQEKDTKPAHKTTPKHTEKPKTDATAETHPTDSNAVMFKISIILLLLLVIVIMGCIIFIPGFRDSIALFFPQ